VLDQGYSVPEASRSLDVGETVLRPWVQQLQSERTGTTPIGKALTPEQQQIQEPEVRMAPGYGVYELAGSETGDISYYLIDYYNWR